ncbi:unnamed protein product [Rotaria sp. Silwood1]|nr:unnamed protein product [Rotaria sp. Silwood1]
MIQFVIINFLFNRHYFINLQSCIFLSINPSTKLGIVIKQLKTLNRRVSFKIHQPNNKNLNQIYKYYLTRILLMHKSSFLHSIVLQYPYNYFDISNNSSISSNLISLKLLISDSPSIVFVYSILPVLRLCCTIRYLTIIVECTHSLENDHINFSIETPSINENNLPILPRLTSFNLTILAICDIRSISYILRGTPNLIHFHFVLETRSANWPFSHNLLNGSVWQQILEYYVPHLTKFEFLMSITRSTKTTTINDHHLFYSNETELGLACPNVMNLIISSEYLLLSELIDNEFLIPIFKQIKIIESITNNIYFPLNCASQFLERFPSLSHIELQVCLFDDYVHLIEIFIIHLTNLSDLNINYRQDTLLDDSVTCDYLIKKRRQTFPNHILNEQRINAKNNGKTIEIWLL